MFPAGIPLTSLRGILPDDISILTRSTERVPGTRDIAGNIVGGTQGGPGDTGGRVIRLPIPWCRSTRAGDGILRRARSPGSSTGPLLSLRTRSGRVCRRALLARSSQSGAPGRSGRSCSTSCRSPGSLRCPREHFHGGVS